MDLLASEVVNSLKIVAALEAVRGAGAHGELVPIIRLVDKLLGVSVVYLVVLIRAVVRQRRLLNATTDVSISLEPAIWAIKVPISTQDVPCHSFNLNLANILP